MISLLLDTKHCMSELLLRNTFDHFLFIEGEITTYNKFTIDGYIRKEFYGDNGPETAPAETHSTWDRLRDFCFSIIKGKQTPLNFRFIFSLPKSETDRLIADKQLDFQPDTVQGLYLNFKYDGSVLACTSGTSLNTFTLDKSLEHAFDKWICEFFSAHGINWNMQ
jgi:hypothetical protein